jgi:hypothetical protein
VRPELHPNSCQVYPLAAVSGRMFGASLVLNEDQDFLLNVMQSAALRRIPVSGAIIDKTQGRLKKNAYQASSGYSGRIRTIRVWL